MYKKLLIFTIALTLIATIIFASRSDLNSATAQTSVQTTSSEIPDYIIYRQLFRHVDVYKMRADELQRQGRNPSIFRDFFKRKVELRDDEAQKLEQTAIQFALEVKTIDERAKMIAQAYKAQYPNGQVPRGQQPLPPPVELRQLTEERNNLVMRKRDELRSLLGDESFGRLHQFVRSKISIK